MITIAMYSYKGGTGKTKTAFNMAGFLAAEHKAKVLIIDADGQANITSFFLFNEFEENNGFEYLRDEVTIEDLFLHPKDINKAIRHATIKLREGSNAKKKGIDIIPVKPPALNGCLHLEYINSTMAIEAAQKDNPIKAIKPGCIKEALSCIKRTKNHPYDYDYCIIDLHGDDDYASREFIAAADYILSPMTCDFGAIDGVRSINTSMIKKLKSSYNTKVKLIGEFFSNVDINATFDKDMIEQVKSMPGFIDCSIRHSQDAKMSTENNIPIAFNRKTSATAQDYRQLTQIVVDRIKADKEGR